MEYKKSYSKTGERVGVLLKNERLWEFMLKIGFPWKNGGFKGLRSKIEVLMGFWAINQGK